MSPVIGAPRAPLVATLAGLFAACGGTDADRCAPGTTCVRLDVDGLTIEAIDQLELDLVYDDHHATITTGTNGTPVRLPISVPITLELSSPLIHLEVVAAGRLGGTVLGGGAASTSVQQGYQAALDIFLFPFDPCTEGELYCGGTFEIEANHALYRCTGGVPIFYARCRLTCFDHLHAQGYCAADGLCSDGGTYCGGHSVDGDPGVLYICSQFRGTAPRRCPQGCVVRGDGNDACQ
jgi:hypothetical protein